MNATDKTVRAVAALAQKWCPPERAAEFLHDVSELIRVAVTESTDHIVGKAPAPHPDATPIDMQILVRILKTGVKGSGASKTSYYNAVLSLSRDGEYHFESTPSSGSVARAKQRAEQIFGPLTWNADNEARIEVRA